MLALARGGELGNERVSARARAALRLAAGIRYREFLALAGAPLVAAALAIDSFSPPALGRLAGLLAADLLLLAHVFTLNDWADQAVDAADPRKARTTFEARGLPAAAALRLSVVLGAGSLLAFASLGARPLAIAALLVATSLAYSHPSSHGKGRPVASSLLHIAGGLLHFLLGYSVFNAPDLRAVAIGAVFALVFAAGHLHQELRDLDGDRRSDVSTNAVRFGHGPTFIAAQGLFGLAYALLPILVSIGYLPRPVGWLALLFPLQLVFAAGAWRRGLGFDAIARLQLAYRVLFAAVGLITVAALLYR